MTTTQTPNTRTDIITMDITIAGETRTIGFRQWNPEQGIALSSNVFGCRRGQGKKIHRTGASICLVDGEWVFNWRSGYALNRGDCLIVAFADQVNDSRKSQHTGTAF
jgi:hypothetical protein